MGDGLIIADAAAKKIIIENGGDGKKIDLYRYFYNEDGSIEYVCNDAGVDIDSFHGRMTKKQFNDVVEKLREGSGEIHKLHHVGSQWQKVRDLPSHFAQAAGIMRSLGHIKEAEDWNRKVIIAEEIQAGLLDIKFGKDIEIKKIAEKVQVELERAAVEYMDALENYYNADEYDVEYWAGVLSVLGKINFKSSKFIQRQRIREKTASENDSRLVGNGLVGNNRNKGLALDWRALIVGIFVSASVLSYGSMYFVFFVLFTAGSLGVIVLTLKEMSRDKKYVICRNSYGNVEEIRTRTGDVILSSSYGVDSSGFIQSIIVTDALKQASDYTVCNPAAFSIPISDGGAIVIIVGYDNPYTLAEIREEGVLCISCFDKDGLVIGVPGKESIRSYKFMDYEKNRGNEEWLQFLKVPILKALWSDCDTSIRENLDDAVNILQCNLFAIGYTKRGRLNEFYSMVIKAYLSGRGDGLVVGEFSTSTAITSVDFARILTRKGVDAKLVASDFRRTLRWIKENGKEVFFDVNGKRLAYNIGGEIILGDFIFDSDDSYALQSVHDRGEYVEFTISVPDAERYALENPGKFMLADKDVFDLDLEKNTYDLAISMNLIGHLDTYEARLDMIKSLGKTLNEGGYLIIGFDLIDAAKEYAVWRRAGRYLVRVDFNKPNAGLFVGVGMEEFMDIELESQGRR